jgi:hypothetical protein
MSILISIGTLGREDPTDPHAPLRVNWPAPTVAGHPHLPGLPVRAFNLRSWDTWRRSRSVRAFLQHCRVPADVDRPIIVPLDAPLLVRIDAIYHVAERWSWLPWANPIRRERAQWLHAWAQHARATFGDRAYLSFS